MNLPHDPPIVWHRVYHRTDRVVGFMPLGARTWNPIEWEVGLFQPQPLMPRTRNDRLWVLYSLHPRLWRDAAPSFKLPWLPMVRMFDCPTEPRTCADVETP